MKHLLRISFLILNLSFLISLASLAQKTCKTTVRGVRVTDFRAARKGDKMDVSMNIVLDSLKLKADKQLILTPVLTDGDNAVYMRKVFVNGRKSQLHYLRKLDKAPKADDIVRRRMNGKTQTIPYTATVAYQPWMRDYEAFLKENDCGCGDSLDTNDTFLGKAFKPRSAFIVPPAEVKVRDIEKVSRVTFVVNRIELNPTYMQNPAELDSIYRTIDLVRRDKNVTIKNINIHGFASPESPYDHNEYLASNRAKTLKDYVRQMLGMREDVFTSSYTPEDWDGLVAFIKGGNPFPKIQGQEASNARDIPRLQLPHINEILDIIATDTADRDACEDKIKKLYPEDYRLMYETWYPHLRRSNYRVSYVVRSFTVEESKELIYTKPQLLSTNEMFLVAQTYKPGSKEFNEVMEIAVRNHPNDTIANLNAGVTRIEAGDIDGARHYIAKAGQSAEAFNAAGIIAWYDDDLSKAADNFSKAAAMGLKTAEENLNELKEQTDKK